MKKFSIITVCKDSPDIKKTCESVVSQTFRDFEWIIIDGASENSTLKILEKYRPQTSQFISEPDDGIYNAMNKGLSLMQGEYVLFLDGGDRFYDDEVLEKFSQNLSADVIYGNAYEIGETLELCQMPDEIEDDFFIYSRLMHPATVVKREFFKKFGGFDETLKIVADWEKFIVFQKGGASFKKLDAVLAEFSSGGVSTSKTSKRAHQKERATVLKKYFSEKEIRTCFKKHFPPTFTERIYSLKNEGTHKILRLLGFSFRIPFEFFG